MEDEAPIDAQRIAVAIVVAFLVLAPLVPITTLASHAGNHPSSKGNVDNKGIASAKPDLSSNDDDPGAAGVQVTPLSGKTKTVSVSVDSKDPNGHNDVKWVNVTVYKPDNATVHITKSSASKSSGSAKTATHSYSFGMKYWHDPGTYHVKVVSTDRKGVSETSWSSFDYAELSAISMNVSTASFDDGDGDGSLDPGDVTHATPINMTVENEGNVQIDLSFNGTDATNSDGDVIESTNLHLDADQDNDFSTNEWKMKKIKQTVTTFNLKPSSDGTTSSTYILWAIHVPKVPPGQYKGSMTLEAVKG